VRVFTYRNLAKKCWSVRAENGEDKGRVWLRGQVVSMSAVVPVVGEAGRQRVLRERRKNVHAGLRGTWVETYGATELADVAFAPLFDASETDEDLGIPDDWWARPGWRPAGKDGWLQVRYNPYEAGEFRVGPFYERAYLGSEFVLMLADGSAWAFEPHVSPSERETAAAEALEPWSAGPSPSLDMQLTRNGARYVVEFAGQAEKAAARRPIQHRRPRPMAFE